MKEKTQKRTMWAARDNDNELLITCLYSAKPVWKTAHNFWIGEIAPYEEMALDHNRERNHYGLEPGECKKLVVELTIREAE